MKVPHSWAAYVTFSIDPRIRSGDKGERIHTAELRFSAVTVQFVDTLGLIAAAFSTLCGVPQAVKVVRDKETRAISLLSTLGFAIGAVVWLSYGIARVEWPLIASSGVSLVLTLLILRFKLHYG